MEFIQKNILLFVVAAVSGALLLWPLVRRSAGGPWVSTLQATQLMNHDDALVLDVREAADYAKGHILGAKNLPAGDVARRAPEFDKHKARPVIVSCGDGSRAGAAAAQLRSLGFTNVHNLHGGFAGWQAAGLPVEK